MPGAWSRRQWVLNTHKMRIVLGANAFALYVVSLFNRGSFCLPKEENSATTTTWMTLEDVKLNAVRSSQRNTHDMTLLTGSPQPTQRLK